MPKKRNTSWIRKKKEKQILTARLIEISIKMENYIYKHKPISVYEAEQYMREVSSYKTQCSEDERSLQVIEKLTRCMKGIILDHQKLSVDNNANVINIGNGSDRAGSTSPVYSIPDEDRTQFSQVAEARAIHDKISNQEVEIVDLSQIGDDDDFIHNENSPKTADYENSRVTVEVEIHKSMSSLSLRDVINPVKIISTDVDCSQSILNNFEGIEQMQQDELNIVRQGAAIDGLAGTIAEEFKTTKVMQAGDNAMFDKFFGKVPNNAMPFIVPKKPVKPVTHDTKSSMIENKRPSNPLTTTNHSLSNTEKNCTISSQTFNPETNTFFETQKTNRTCTINDSSHTLKEANYITEPAYIHKVVNPIIGTNVNIPTNNLHAAKTVQNTVNSSETSTPLINNIAVVKDSTATKKKRVPRKKKITDENEIKPKSKKIPQPAKNNKENSNFAKNPIPIYNENVINDLSWIENIRYVREIKIDENDPKLNCEDSFWDNYHLPVNWSESEFV